MALNISFCEGKTFGEMLGSRGVTPNTNNDGTSPSGLVQSFMAFTEIRRATVGGKEGLSSLIFL